MKSKFKYPEERNITHLRIVDAEGNIINEQDLTKQR